MYQTSSLISWLLLDGGDPRKKEDVNAARVKAIGRMAGLRRSGVRSAAASLKRENPDSFEPAAKRSKTEKTTHPGNVQTVLLPHVAPLTSDAGLRAEDSTDTRVKVMLQCAGYATCMLSYAGLRTHVIGCLIGNDQVQCMYYDRSAIVVSTPISISENTNLFCAMIVAIHRLTLPQRGVMEGLMEGRFLKNYNEYTTSMDDDPTTLFFDGKLRLRRGVQGKKQIVLKLGRVLLRQPGLIGRGTCVIEATSDHEDWKGLQLVVKISWPSVDRTSEVEFVNDILATADKLGAEAKWVKDHLPNILYAEDFAPGKNSPAHKLSEYFKNEAKLAPDTPGFNYEKRVCRITVHERLHRLSELTELQDYAQVLFDILQGASFIFFEYLVSNILV